MRRTTSPPKPRRSPIERWRSDPALFIEEVLCDPETGRPFVLTDAERTFVRHAFERTPDGRFRHPEWLYSAVKKTGKTTFAAMLLLTMIVLFGGRFAEGYCCANDLEQSTSRVFLAVSRIVEASPLLAADADVYAQRIEFRSTRSTIQALASDYAGAAGANPTITVFDELWGYTSERSRRLFDEMVPPPTRRLAARLTVTYAGFEGESELLEELYRQGLRGEQIAEDLYSAGHLLMFWTHRFTAPWQTEEWREQMRATLRPNAYLRMIENRWVSTDSEFVPVEWWDGCVDLAHRPVLQDRRLKVFVGVDASVKRDSTAIVVTDWDPEEKRVRLVWHRIFQPSPSEPLDFEATVETTIRDLVDRFDVEEVRYDPYQMHAVATRLRSEKIPMVEFPQTVPNLTEASTNLYEILKGRNLIAYPDPALRLAIQRSVARETSRGWRIAKEKASHKIDVVVALAMSSLAATTTGQAPERGPWAGGLVSRVREARERGVVGRFAALRKMSPTERRETLARSRKPKRHVIQRPERSPLTGSIVRVREERFETLEEAQAALARANTENEEDAV